MQRAQVRTGKAQHCVVGGEFVKAPLTLASMTPLQLKLARTALGLGVRELAEAAKVSPTTISRFEAQRGGMQTGTLDRLQAALEQGGVVFIERDASGYVGVRLRF